MEPPLVDGSEIPAMAPSADVVLTFFTTWATAAERGFGYPEDRLALALINHPRVRSVLVCDAFRSASRRLARSVMGDPQLPFPFSPTASHCSPVRLRAQDPASIRGLQRDYAAYERRIRSAAIRRGLVQPAIITCNPFLAGFGRFDWAGPVTYYGWDDWTAFEPRRRLWGSYREALHRLRESGHRVVAVTDTILDRLQPTGPAMVVPNGIDASEWTAPPAPPRWFAERPSPRLIYLGTLESRVDVQQLKTLAADLPTASITLVGTVHDPDHFTPLDGAANVQIHPPIPRTEVPGLLAHADVGLIPHVRSPLTEAMSPLKLYEYLAAGLPVAAVDLPGTRGISDRVALVPTGASLLPAVQRALATGRQDEDGRLAFVHAHSWERRFDALLGLALPENLDEKHAPTAANRPLGG